MGMSLKALLSASPADGRDRAHDRLERLLVELAVGRRELDHQGVGVGGRQPGEGRGLGRRGALLAGAVELGVTGDPGHVVGDVGRRRLLGGAGHAPDEGLGVDRVAVAELRVRSAG